MKRLQRAIIAILCVVCLAFGVFACGGDPSESSGDQATYTVEVTGGTHLVLATVTVKLQNAEGADATAAKSLTNGKATFKLKKGTYTVVLDGDFGEFVVQSGNKNLTSSVHSTKITLKKEEEAPPVTVEYRVRFLMPDNTPVSDIKVQVCGIAEGSSCHLAKTDENGWATWNLAATDYHVDVPEENWPTGYYFDSNAYTLSAQTREKTVKFSAYIQYSAKVYYAVEDILGGYEAGDPVPNLQISMSVYDNNAMGGSDNVVGTATTDANGAASIISKPEDLWVDILNIPDGYVLRTGDSRIILKPYGSDETTPLELLLYEAGTSPYTCAALPLGTDTTVTVASASDAVWYEFRPTQSGEYTLTSDSEFDVEANMPPAAGGNVNIYGDVRNEEPNTYKKDGNNFTLTFCIDASEIGSRYVFKFSGSVSESSTFTVNVERTGDYEAPQVIEKTIVEPKEIIASKDMPEIPAESKFTLFNTTGGYVINKDPDDGLYYVILGATKKAVVYASLGDKYLPHGFIGEVGFKTGVEESGGIGFGFSDGKTYNYDYYDFVTEYCKDLNVDGLHPLTDELITFLNLYGTSINQKNEAMPDSTYIFACGYYDSIYGTLDADTENADNDYFVHEPGLYKLEVPATSTVKFTYDSRSLLTDTKDYNVTVQTGTSNIKLLDANGDVQTTVVVSADSQSSNKTFSIQNTGNTATTVVISVDYKTASKSITALGSYVVKTGEDYMFTAPKAGYYLFAYSGDDSYNFYTVDNSGATGNAVNPMKLTNGQKVNFRILAHEGAPVATLVISEPAITEVALDVAVEIERPSGDFAICKFTAQNEGSYNITALSDEGVILVDGEDGIVALENAVRLEEGETYVFYVKLDGYVTSVNVKVTSAD